MRIHVVAHDGRWAVKRDGQDDYLFVDRTLAEAERDAKRYAREQGDSDVAIHEPDGRVRVFDTVQGREVAA